MNRTRVFLKNSLITAVLQVVTMLAGFVVPRVMLTFYGSEINGLVTSITQFIACFNLVEAGISAAAIYSLYVPLATHDIKLINGIIVAARNFYNRTGYIFVSVTLGFALIYPAFVETDQLSSLEVGMLILIMGINGALEFFTLAKYRVLLTADQKTYVISVVSIVAILLNVTILTGMAFAGFSVVFARFVAVGAIFLRSLLLYEYCQRHYAYMDFSVAPCNEAMKKRWDALYLQILGVIHGSAPIILATVLTDLKTVSVFAIFNLVAVGLQGVLGVFTSGLAASFGDVIARKEIRILQEAFIEFEYVYNMLIVAVYSVAVIFIQSFVMLFTNGITDADYHMPMLGVLLMLNGWLYNLKTPQGMLVISAGLYRENRVQVTVQGLIELLGGGILGWFYGIYGILFGMLLSNIYRDLDLPFLISKMVTKLSPWKTFQQRGIAILVGAGILTPSFYLEMTMCDFLHWLIWLVGYMIYSLLLVVIVSYIMEPIVVKKLVSRFKGIWRS